MLYPYITQLGRERLKVPSPKEAADVSDIVLSAASSFSGLWFYGFPRTPRRGNITIVGPRPFTILFLVGIDGCSEVIGVQPTLLVKDMPAGGYYDRGAGSMGVGAPHRLVERAVRVAREVVRKDNLLPTVLYCEVNDNKFTRKRGGKRQNTQAGRLKKRADTDFHKHSPVDCPYTTSL